MLQIRLHRTGKTNRPFFRVVVAEHRRAAQGPYVSALGFWDPIAKKLKLNKEELKTWMDRGAKPSDRMSRLLTKEGMKHKHIVIHQRPARGPKKLEPKPEPSEKVATSDQATVTVESPAETIQEPAQPAKTEQDAETSTEPAAESQLKEEVKAEPVESAANEVNTAKVEGEERAKSPTSDQA